MEQFGNLDKSMRRNYANFGVDKYYQRIGSVYRNPHFAAVQKCLDTWFDVWWRKEGAEIIANKAVRVLDLAAGSGEVTICVLDWWQSRTRPIPSASSALPISGVQSSSAAARPAFIPPSKLRALQQQQVLGPDSPWPSIAAVDPFTAEAYKQRTGRICQPLSFADITQGSWPIFPSQKTPASGEVDHHLVDTITNNEDIATATNALSVDMVICSFALHLVETPSELFALLWELSTKARWLIILSPHKKPEIKDTWGWNLWDSQVWASVTEGGSAEILKDRVHCRVFRSTSV